MKKFLIYILTFVFALGLLSGAIVPQYTHANFLPDNPGSLKITSKISDTVSSAGQTVNIEITYSNESEEQIISDIKIGDNSLEPLDPMESIQATIQYKISENDFQSGSFTLPVTWKESNFIEETFSGKLTIEFEKIEPVIEISLNRTVEISGADTSQSKILVQLNQIARFKYAITNTSDRAIEVKLTDIEVFSGAEAITVNPGETVEKVKELRLKTDIVSEPSIEYTDATGAKKTVYAENKTIKIEVAVPNIKLTISPASKTVKYGDDLKIEYTIQNDSNVDFKDLTVYDTLGNALLTIDSLPAKSPKQKRSVQVKSLTENRKFKFSITGTDTLTNTLKTFYSNEETVSVEYSEADLVLEVSAQPSQTSLNAPGNITFSINIKNNSNFNVRDVDVYVVVNGTQTKIGTVALILKGETHDLVYTANIQQSSSYYFSAEVNDPKGKKLTFQTNEPISIELKPTPGTNTTQPDGTPTPEPEPESAPTLDPNLFAKTIMYILFTLLILMVASGLTYLILFIFEKRHKKKSRMLRGSSKLR